MDRTSSHVLHERLTAAMDIKDAATAKDSFAAHVEAPEKEEVVGLNKDLNEEFSSPRPSLDRLDKLVSLKNSLKTRHIDVAPEEELWREQMEDAVRSLE